MCVYTMAKEDTIMKINNILTAATLSLILFSANSVFAENSELQIGDKAPGFQLLDQDGNPIVLHEFLNKKHVVLYFYPKNDTSGCTAEAISFRDSILEFKKHDAVIIGVSEDSAQSHQAFREKYELPFPLIPDYGKELRKLYNVENDFFVIPGRYTFLIDKQGVIRFIYDSQSDAEGHVTKSLQALKDIVSSKQTKTQAHK